MADAPSFSGPSAAASYACHQQHLAACTYPLNQLAPGSLMFLWNPAPSPKEPCCCLASVMSMPRSKPSKADQELVRQAAEAGYHVNAAQLERWRRSGVLPAPARLHLGRHGSHTVYPDGTGDLVCALAKHAGPGRSLQDVALLAFFDDAAVPQKAVKDALAATYFTGRFVHTDRVNEITDSVPGGWSGELGPHYEAAEADARIDLEAGGRAIRQMRINLRRLPDLAKASRHEVDQRLLGVLVGLNLPRLPQQDLDLMSDLSVAVDLDCDHEACDALAVWEYAAISHAAQMADYQETSPEERYGCLLEATAEELADLRVQVKTACDQMWERASGGIHQHAPHTQPWMARAMASMLVEWMTARMAHPPGVRLADRYFIQSLSHLGLCCLATKLPRVDPCAWPPRRGKSQTGP